jgi:hypothetical protein
LRDIVGRRALDIHATFNFVSLIAVAIKSARRPCPNGAEPSFDSLVVDICPIDYFVILRDRDETARVSDEPFADRE